MMPQRNEVIDAYRSILILSVVIYHYFVFWAPPFTSVDLYHYDNTYPKIIGIGSFGVQVFFVISGIVITMTLLKSTDTSDFIFKRFSRLFPTFFVCCTLTYLISITIKVDGYIPSFFDYIFSLTLHPERFGHTYVDGAYWSLALEVRFYIWVAIFFFLLKERFWIGVVSLGIAALIDQITAVNFTAYFLVGKGINFFLIGMSLFYFKNRYNVKAASWCLAIGLLLTALRYNEYSVDGNFIIAGNIYIYGLTAFLFFFYISDYGSAVKIPILSSMGRASYSLYLLHQQIGVIIIGGVKQHTGLPDFAAAVIALSVCVALSLLVFRFVEEPCQAVLRTLWQNRRSMAVKRRSSSAPT